LAPRPSPHHQTKDYSLSAFVLQADEGWLEKWVEEDGERILEFLRKVVATCGMTLAAAAAQSTKQRKPPPRKPKRTPAKSRQS